MPDHHRIGDPIPADNRPTVYELVIYDHVPFVNPADYKVEFESIDPHYYFITSGDAVEKTRVLEREMWELAGKVRKHIKTIKKPTKLQKEYEKAVWNAAGKARTLLRRLREARGTDCFLETEWDDHKLLCVAKNPRSKE